MSHESSCEIETRILSSMSQYLKNRVFGVRVDKRQLLRSHVRQTTLVPDEHCQVSVVEVLDVLLLGPDQLLESMMTLES